ncbi:hypothetical protein QSH39_004075 [Xanthomonas arboricola pv. corylina]|uniref:hypothetical protein n=1 Tax=Xanthomonas arboricola TaxID=56448 RepID=UPI0015E45150|nr:hypothetical protein [Xanthomonas arboricola]
MRFLACWWLRNDKYGHRWRQFSRKLRIGSRFFLPVYGNLHAKNVRKENLRYVTQRSACSAVRCNRTVRWRTVCAKAGATA